MKHLYISTVLLIVTLLTACNGDIFLDEPALPYETNITLEGDGGVAVVTIPLKDLQGIGFRYFDTQINTTYYNATGEKIDNKSPVSEISLIVYESDFSRFEIHRQGSRLTLKSVCSTYKYDNHDEIELEYRYGYRRIQVTILPGKPMKLESVHYNGPLSFNTETKVSSRIGFENTSPTDLVCTEFPYLNQQPYVFIEPMSLWAKDTSVAMEVPVYENGEWVIKEKTLSPGKKSYYPGPDYMTSVDISIPGATNGYIITSVDYECAMVSGTMYYVNEILDRRVPVDFNLSSFYPVSYDIRIEETH